MASLHEGSNQAGSNDAARSGSSASLTGKRSRASTELAGDGSAQSPTAEPRRSYSLQLKAATIKAYRGALKALGGHCGDAQRLVQQETGVPIHTFRKWMREPVATQILQEFNIRERRSRMRVNRISAWSKALDRVEHSVLAKMQERHREGLPIRRSQVIQWAQTAAFETAESQSAELSESYASLHKSIKFGTSWLKMFIRRHNPPPILRSSGQVTNDLEDGDQHHVQSTVDSAVGHMENHESELAGAASREEIPEDTYDLHVSKLVHGHDLNQSGPESAHQQQHQLEEQPQHHQVEQEQQQQPRQQGVDSTLLRSEETQHGSQSIPM